MTRVLYPFQETAVQYHLDHHYSLNCSEMGVGKSTIALTTARRAGLKPLVFGPAFLRGTWDTEAKIAGVAIDYAPYSALHRIDQNLLKARFWIADEVHYLKNPSAKRTHQFYGYLKEYAPEYFLGMTGTPVKNRIPDLWTLLGFCGVNPRGTSGPQLEGNLRKYYAFSAHFCDLEEMVIRGRKIRRYTGLKSERVAELKGLLQGKYIRYRVADVLKDLPELTRKHVSIVVDCPPLEESELRLLFLDYTAGRKVDSNAKARSALLKAEETAVYVKGIYDCGSGPIVVFTDHLEAAAMLGRHLGVKTVVTGQTPMELRHQCVTDFQAGKMGFLVATIGSLSVGVTLTAARHVVFNDLSWVPADNLQAEKRIHRIGQKDACFSHFIEGTATDTHINRILLEKIETIQKVVP